ncbi:MAG: hypothetical protein AB3N11_10045, partial [Arenibacterium sp.]
MRTAWVAILILIASVQSLCAQTEPVVSVEMPEAETFVGQPIVVRVKVLVPTWMPSPPDFPSLEVPGLMIRLPERASRPVSERIGSETWSGVQRSYRIYPLQEGNFVIPGQPVRIRYAVPGSIDARAVEATLPEIAFSARVPAGARGLDNLIIARDFSIEAQVAGPREVQIGDAVVRTITAQIDGTTPVLIPELTPAATGDALRSYHDEPKVTETEDRGVLSGTREERVTYVAQTEGAAELPPVRIEWYSLETGDVETAEVPAVSLIVSPAPSPTISFGTVPWRVVGAAIVVLVSFGLIVRRLWPKAVQLFRTSRERYLTSETHAHRCVLAAIRKRDLGAVLAALENWRTFFPPMSHSVLEQPLTQLGKNRFSLAASKSRASAWLTLRKAYVGLRRDALHHMYQSQNGQSLSRLNPDWQ